MQAVQRFFSWWSGTFKKQGHRGKVALGCSSLIILCCICSVPIAVLSPAKSTPEVTKTTVAEIAPIPVSELVLPTETKAAGFTPTETTLAAISPTETIIPTIAPSDTPAPTPTETIIPTIVPSDTPAPTPTEKVSALLPGLTPADVTENLKQGGFTCSSVEQGELYYIRTCTIETVSNLVRVDIFGRELFSVDFIDSSVIQYSNVDNRLPPLFLGFIATMPYDGAVQQEARKWVETTLPTIKKQGDIAEKVFAGVTYRLKGIPTFITLEMGDLP